MNRRLLVLVVALAMALVGCEADTPLPDPTLPRPPDPTTTTAPERLDLESVREATVHVAMVRRNAAGEFVGIGWGSGAIVDPSGLILTNAHVAAPEAPGQKVLYVGTPGSDLDRTNPDVLLIGIYQGEDQLPDLRYQAEVVTADGWLDLAVIRIISDREGNPVEDLALPYLRLGDSNTVRTGDPLGIVGYPGDAGRTITTIQNANSTGFEPDDKIEGLTRGWIKYIPGPGGGISGGVAVDRDLLLVGTPTRGGARFGQFRPVNLAKELIADAQAGLTYQRGTGIIAGSGQQQFNLVGWGTEVEQGGCVVNPRRALPSGIEEKIVAFDYAGFTPGEDVVWQWDINDNIWGQEFVGYSGWPHPASGSCFLIPSRYDDRRTLPDGTYTIRVYAGETLRLIANESVEVGGEIENEGTIQVAARVYDRDSGEQILGAQVILLEPGTDARSWGNETPRDLSKVVATSLTAATGHVPFDNPLEPGTAYPYVIEMPPGMADYYLWYPEDPFTFSSQASPDVLYFGFPVWKRSS